ncbi:MAG: P-II family nitrogen regulator [Nitrospirae bacterium]|nr:P-II family nitrogen regulator [Nitrospirota bacterium]
MHKMITAVIRRALFDKITAEFEKRRIHFTCYPVKGFGKEVRLYHDDIHDRVKIEIIADEKDVDSIKEIFYSNVNHGTTGAGILAVYSIDEFVEFSEVV